MAKFDPQKVIQALGSSAVPLIGGAAALSGLYYAGNNCIFNVDAGHRAIKFNRLWGLGDAAYEEGVHLLLPWFERPIVFDIRARPRTIVSLTGSRDLQMVNISVRTLCRPDEFHLPDVYRSLGHNYDEKVLPSIVNECLKAVVAQYNAAELVQKREQVSLDIKRRLTERASDFNIMLDDVAITHLAFSPEYDRAVESKQVAQQQAEKARFKVLKAQEEKKNIIIKAQGEQAAAQMIGHAIKNNPGFVELRRIDVAREVASLLAKSNNRLVLSADALLLNLMDQKVTDTVCASANRKPT